MNAPPPSPAANAPTHDLVRIIRYGPAAVTRRLIQGLTEHLEGTIVPSIEKAFDGSRGVYADSQKTELGAPDKAYWANYA
jgi:hypothetical protein